MKGRLQSFLIHRELVCQRSSNMQTQIYPNTLKIYSDRLEKLVEDLETKFPHQPIHPKEQLPSIMYRAGQESVVAYVKQILKEN